MRWVTQRRPKIDRLASPWPIRRFVDPEAEFLFVPAGEVRRTADATGAIPFDLPSAMAPDDLTHPPGGTSFDAICERFGVRDPALDRVARIVRDADNDNIRRRSPEAAGLRAISLGLAKTVRDDHQRLAHGFALYDALYQWARRAPPKAAGVSFALPELVGDWLSRARQRRALACLDSRLLGDIGLSAVDAQPEIVKPFWRG